jgi:hypothetical protein
MYSYIVTQLPFLLWKFKHINLIIYNSEQSNIKMTLEFTFNHGIFLNLENCN